MVNQTHFLCLFFSSTREFFTCLETSPLPVKGCKFWPMLGTYGHSLVCHTFCDMGDSFLMVISQDPWHSHLIPSVWQWSCHHLFITTYNNQRYVAVWILTQKPSACEANTLTHCAIAAAQTHFQMVVYVTHFHLSVYEKDTTEGGPRKWTS